MLHDLVGLFGGPGIGGSGGCGTGVGGSGGCGTGGLFGGLLIRSY